MVIVGGDKHVGGVAGEENKNDMKMSIVNIVGTLDAQTTPAKLYV